MLDALADRLYALPREDFTAARDAAAREHRELAPQIKALRKPTAAAALVNALARDQPDLLGQLAEVGAALAAATERRSADELRDLSRQRRQLVDAVTAQAVADTSVSAAVREEVAATLEAALVDPASADAVRSGRLVRALSYAGFGGVDLEGAVAGPARTSRRATAAAPTKGETDATGAAAIAAAEQAAQRAAGALDDAVRRWQSAAGAQEAAAQQAATQAELLAEAERRLAHARAELEAATQRVDESAKATEDAQQAVVRAQAAAERTRADLDRLRRA